VTARSGCAASWSEIPWRPKRTQDAGGILGRVNEELQRIGALKRKPSDQGLLRTIRPSHPGEPLRQDRQKGPA